MIIHGQNMPRNKDTGSCSSNGWEGFYGMGLTRREVQSVVAVAAGLTSKHIAQQHRVAPASVDKLVRAAMYHLKAKNRAELIGKAMAKGIIRQQQVSA